MANTQQRKRRLCGGERARCGHRGGKVRFRVGKSIQVKKKITKIKFGFAFGKGCCRHRTYVDLEVLPRRDLHHWPRCPLAYVVPDFIFQRAVIRLQRVAEAVFERFSPGQGGEQLNELCSSLAFRTKNQVVHERPRLGIEHPLLRFFVVFGRVLLNGQEPF